MNHHRHTRLSRALRLATVVGLAIALSGCIVVPPGRYGYYRPYPYHYSYY